MSRVTVCIPPPLRVFTDGAGEVPVEAATVGDALVVLGRTHDGLLARIMTPEGELRPRVNVFVDEESVKTLQGLATRLSAGATVVIVPAVAGG
jgi:molybdopterin synthase sulfur carrier subunit